MALFKFKKRGVTSVIQTVLLFILVLTLLANLYFIMDVASKLNQEQQRYGSKQVDQIPLINRDITSQKPAQYHNPTVTGIIPKSKLTSFLNLSFATLTSLR